MKRTLIIVASVLAGLVALVLILGPLLVPKDRIRVLVVDRLEAALHRPVSIAAVDLALFPSPRCELRGIEIGDKPAPGTPRLTAESLRLGLNLLALLGRRVEITRVDLVRPAVEMVLQESKAPTGDQGARPPATGSPLEVRVRRFQIDEGRVTVLLPDGKPLLRVAGLSEVLSAGVSTQGEVTLDGRTEVDSLRLYLVNGTIGEGLHLRLDKELRFDPREGLLEIREATLQVAGVPVAVRGKVEGLGDEKPVLDLQLEGGPADIDEIAGLLPARMVPTTKGIESSGVLQMEGWVRGPADDSDFNVTLDLRDGRIQAPDLPHAIEGVRVSLRADPESLEVREFAMQLGTSQVRGRVTLTDYQRVPRFVAAVDADLDLETVSRFYLDPDSMRLAGRTTARIMAEGRADRPQEVRINGTARLTSVEAQGAALSRPVRDMQGDLVFEGQSLSARNLTAHIGASDLRVNGSLQDYLALQDPQGQSGRARIDLRLQSDLLDLDDLANPGGTAGATDGKRAVKPLPPLPPIDGTVFLSAARLRMRGIEGKNASGRAVLDHGTIRLDGLLVQLFGGNVGLQGTMDLTTPATPRIDLDADLEDVGVGELLTHTPNLNRFGQLAGHLAGRMNSRTKVTGILNDSLMVDPKSLFSEGHLEVLDAKLAGYPLQNALAGFLGAEQLRTVMISDWKQVFRIEEGRFHLEGLNLKAGGVELSARGWQSIDGTMEMSLDLMLPPSYAAALQAKLPPDAAGLLLAAGQDPLFLPLRVSGKAASPSVSLDSAQLSAAAKKAAQARLEAEQARLKEEAAKEAGKLLEGIVGAGDTTSTGETGTKTVEEEIKSRLGKFLKGK